MACQYVCRQGTLWDFQKIVGHIKAPCIIFCRQVVLSVCYSTNEISKSGLVVKKWKIKEKNYPYFSSFRLTRANKTVVLFLHFFRTKRDQMKATKRIITGIGLISTVALFIYTVRRRQKLNRMRMHEEAARQVAEHGYETAHDILYPRRNRRIRTYNRPGWFLNKLAVKDLMRVLKNCRRCWSTRYNLLFLPIVCLVRWQVISELPDQFFLLRCHTQQSHFLSSFCFPLVNDRLSVLKRFILSLFSFQHKVLYNFTKWISSISGNTNQRR